MSITRDQLHQLFYYDAETGLFFNKTYRNPRALKGAVSGDVNGNGYRRIQINKRRYVSHQLVWVYFYGVFPTVQIDHINGDRLDNRLSNLRLATNKENHENVQLRSDNTSGIRGVYWSKIRNKWIAQVTHYGTTLHVGVFEKLEDAAIAVKNARDCLFTHHKTEYSA